MRYEVVELSIDACRTPRPEDGTNETALIIINSISGEIIEPNQNYHIQYPGEFENMTNFWSGPENDYVHNLCSKYNEKAKKEYTKEFNDKLNKIIS